MDIDNILARLLDRSEEQIASLAQLTAKTEQIVTRLDTLNGNVAKHREWIGIKDPQITTLQTDMKAAQESSRMSNQTMLKIAAIASVTVLAITKVEGPVLSALMSLIK